MDMSRIDSTRIQNQPMIGNGPAAAVKKNETGETTQAKDQVSIGSGEKDESGAIKPHKKWLFLNIVAADCNLTKFQLANVDQQELVGSDETSHLVAYVDIGNNPSPMGFVTDKPQVEGQPDPGSWNGCRSLYITKDDTVGKLNSEVIKDYGTGVDMSNPKTLKEFVLDAIRKFPADNVAVIMNSHGGGFTGAMADDTEGSFMSIPDMKQAFSEVVAETGKKIDILGFDACLMAETEVAYAMKDSVNILMASEESEGGPGWTYDTMLGGKTLNEAMMKVQSNLSKRIDVSPYEFAKEVVNVNAQHNGDIPTFSATDLNQMDKVKDSVNNLAKAVIKTEDKQAVKDAIGTAENYGGGWAPYRDIRDLHHLSRNIISKSADEDLKKAAEDVKKAVESAVFANEVNPEQHPESKGLSIYAPTKGSFDPEYKKVDFTEDTLWDEALESLGVTDQPGTKGPKVWPDGSPRKPKA